MNKKLTKTLIETLRNEYPIFRIENVVVDLERTIESTGVLIKYVDMRKLNVTDQTINGYGYTDENERIIFVLDGNQSYNKRREAMAYLLGKIMLKYKWLPDKLRHEISIDGEFVYIDGAKDVVYDFMVEFLLPIEDVKDYIEEKIFEIENEIIRNYLIKNTLSGAYKVSDEVVKARIKERFLWI